MAHGSVLLLMLYILMKLMHRLLPLFLLLIGSARAQSVDLTVDDFGLSIGDSRRVSGVRLNFRDRNLREVNGLNLTLWEPFRPANGIVRGFAIGLPTTGARTISGIGLGVFGVSADQSAYGLMIGGLGAGAGQDVTGITIGRLGVGSGRDIKGLMIGGLGAGSGRDLLGPAVGGLGAGSGSNVRGVIIGGLRSWRLRISESARRAG